MRVLFVNHTATVSGSERSLLCLLGGLGSAVEPILAAPRGDLTERALALGIPVVPITGITGSLRLHALHTPRALLELAAAAAQVRHAAARSHASVVHANSIRSGLVAGRSGRSRVGVVTHVRDVLPAGRTSRAVLRTVARGSAAIVANSRFTAEHFERQSGVQALAIPNPVDVARFDAARGDRAASRARLGVGREEILLVLVGQLTPWKGQDVAVAALAQARRRGLPARLLLVGSAKFAAAATRFDNPAYVRSLQAAIEELGLGGHVSFLGEREDVPALMAAADAVLVPSRREPAGRVVIEAMASGTVVLATSEGGPAEVIEHGRDGLLLDPFVPGAWSDAIEGLAGDAHRRAVLGRAARVTAAGYGITPHVEAMLDVYRSVARR